MSKIVPKINVNVPGEYGSGMKYPEPIEIFCSLRYVEDFDNCYLSLYEGDNLIQRIHYNGSTSVYISNQKPSDEEIEYTFVYDGNKDYEPASKTVSFHYYKSSYSLSKIDEGDNVSSSFIMENCKINLQLLEGDKVSQKDIHYHTDYYNFSGMLVRTETGTLTPNSYGRVEYELTSDILSTAQTTFTVEGDDYYEECSYTTNFEWVAKHTAETILTLNAENIRYRNGYRPIHMTAKAENIDGQAIDGTMSFYVDNVLVSEDSTKNGVAYAINPNNPRETPFNYRVEFSGNNTYAPMSVSKDVYYNRQIPLLVEVRNSSVNHVTEDNEIKFFFCRTDETALTNSALRHSITYYDNDGNVINTVTGFGRTDNEGIYTVVASLNVEGSAEVTVSFTAGSGTYEPVSRTVTCSWVEMEGVHTHGWVESSGALYPNPLVIEGVIEDTNNPDLENREIKLYRNETLVSTTLTNIDGEFAFEDTPVPNRLSDDNDFYTYYFEYDDYGTSKRQIVNKVQYLNKSTFTQLNGSSTVPIGSEGTVILKLSDYAENLVDASVKVDITGLDEGKTITIPSEIKEQTLTTDSSGEILFTFTPQEVGTYEIIFTYEGNEYSPPTKFYKIITYNRIPTTLTLLDKSENLEVTDTGIIQIKLTDTNSNILTNKRVQCDLKLLTENDEEIRVHDSCFDKLVLFTDSNGIITLDYNPSTVGGVTGIFTFTCLEDETYSSSTLTETLFWDYMETSIVLLDRTEWTEATLMGEVLVKLKRNKTNEYIPYQLLSSEISFEDNDTEGNPIPIESVEGIDLGQDRLTNSNGETKFGYIPYKGLLLGYYTISFAGNNLYASSTFFDDYGIEWDKIETTISANNVTAYEGRYTDYSTDMTNSYTELSNPSRIGLDWEILELAGANDVPENVDTDGVNVVLGRYERNVFKIPFLRNGKYKITFTDGYGAYVGLCNSYSNLAKWETIYLIPTNGYIRNATNVLEFTIDNENITITVNENTTINKSIALTYGEHLYFYSHQNNTNNPLTLQSITEITQVPLNEQSIGTDPDYTNFHAKVETVNTQTEHTSVKGNNVYWRINYDSSRVRPVYEGDLPDYYFYGTLDENMEANVRWTDTNGNLMNNGENIIRVDFLGNDIFYPCFTRITYTELRRIQPHLEVEVQPLEEYNYEMLNGVPLGLEATLTGENNEPLINIPLTVTLDEEVIGVYNTDNNGHVSTQIIPHKTGYMPLRVYYNYGDNIDRWI